MAIHKKWVPPGSAGTYCNFLPIYFSLAMPVVLVSWLYALYGLKLKKIHLRLTNISYPIYSNVRLGDFCAADRCYRRIPECGFCTDWRRRSRPPSAKNGRVRRVRRLRAYRVRRNV